MAGVKAKMREEAGRGRDVEERRRRWWAAEMEREQAAVSWCPSLLGFFCVWRRGVDGWLTGKWGGGGG